MKEKEYLDIVKLCLNDSFLSVSKNLPELGLIKIGGMALTHISPISKANPAIVLIRKKAYRSFEDFDSVFVKGKDVASNIYITPIAYQDSRLVMQVDIEEWKSLEEMEANDPIIRSHGLTISHENGNEECVYESLPECEIVADNLEWLVSPFPRQYVSEDDFYSHLKVVFQQIHEGYIISESFKVSLNEILTKEFREEVLYLLIKIVGAVDVSAGSKFLERMLSCSSSELRAEAFYAGVDSYYSELQQQLFRGLKEETGRTRFLMLRKLVKAGVLNKSDQEMLDEDLELSEKEVKLLDSIV